MEEKPINFAMKVDLTTMAELAVAADIIGARSINSLVFQMMKQKIREARGMINESEFAEMVERQKQKTLEHSAKKAAEKQKQLVGEILPKSDKSIPVLKNPKKEERKAG